MHSLSRDNSSFRIRAGEPRVVGAARLEWAESICDALQSCFLLDDVTMTMFWCNVPVELGYKYDLSILSRDIVDMVLGLSGIDSGEMEICWPSNTFRVDWRIVWSAGMLRIHSDWSVALGDVELLRGCPVVELPVRDFLLEWRRPLEILEAGLDASGYVPSVIDGMADLKRAVALLRALSSKELPSRG